MGEWVLMARIEAEGGGDPLKAVMEGLEEIKDEAARDVMDLWFQETTDWLTEAAQRRSELGVRHGRQGRADQSLDQIRKHAVPPMWDPSEGAWVFGFPHHAAIFHEFGAKPHEIRAKKAEVLAFEWPDAPEEIQDHFKYTEGDLVFFESVNHPGVPAIGFMRYGREKAVQLLRSQGTDAEEFIE